MREEASARPPRVLHVVESLDTGAVENWLLRMLKAGHAFGTDLDWTFFCVLSRPGQFDSLARELGATVIHSPVELGSTLAFMRQLRATIDAGSYDIVHFHHDIVSAVYLVAALGLRVRVRIVHVHNADLHVPTTSRFKIWFLREIMRRTCVQLANRIVGISRHTLATFLGGAAPRPFRDTVVYYGIDTGPFHAEEPDRAAFRKSMSLPEHAKILLFVGRMVNYKNPLFVVDVLAEVARTDPTIYAIFAGEGPLENDVENHAEHLGVGERVRVLGWRNDTVELMRAADVIVFPRVEESLEVGKEGLGLVVVEAQAAGLPAVLSTGIPEDAIVIRDLCEVRSLRDGAAAWAGAITAILSRPRPDSAAALSAMEQSPFALEAGFRSLLALYQP